MRCRGGQQREVAVETGSGRGLGVGVQRRGRLVSERRSHLKGQDVIFPTDHSQARQSRGRNHHLPPAAAWERRLETGLPLVEQSPMDLLLRCHWLPLLWALRGATVRQ